MDRPHPNLLSQPTGIAGEDLEGTFGLADVQMKQDLRWRWERHPNTSAIHRIMRHQTQIMAETNLPFRLGLSLRSRMATCFTVIRKIHFHPIFGVILKDYGVPNDLGQYLVRIKETYIVSRSVDWDRAHQGRRGNGQ
jgi:hypothetical protein